MRIDTYIHSATSKTIAHNEISREDFDALDLAPDIKERVLVELADWMDCYLDIEDGKVTHCSSSIMLTNEKGKWNVRYCYSFRRRQILNSKERINEAKQIAELYWQRIKAEKMKEKGLQFA